MPLLCPAESDFMSLIPPLAACFFFPNVMREACQWLSCVFVWESASFFLYNGLQVQEVDAQSFNASNVKAAPLEKCDDDNTATKDCW